MLAKIPGLEGDGADVVVLFQGQAGADPGNRAAARRRLRGRGQRAQVRRQGPHHRAAHQGGGRLPCVERHLHARPEGHLRRAGRDRRAIAKNLELKMGIGETRRGRRSMPAPFRNILLGRAAAAKAGMADLREAVTHFEQAVAMEPKYTAAWVQLASAHTQLGPLGRRLDAAIVAGGPGRDRSGPGVEPDSPEVLLALGWILRTSDWDWRGAERAFRRRSQLRPEPARRAGGLGGSPLQHRPDRGGLPSGPAGRRSSTRSTPPPRST